MVRGWRRAVLLGLVSGALGYAAHALADAQDGQGAELVPTAGEAQNALARRLSDLSQRELADPHAKQALEQAERALARANQARSAHNHAEAERVERLADAALTLAERLDALARERALLRIALDRKRSLGERKRAAEQALVHERARLHDAPEVKP